MRYGRMKRRIDMDLPYKTEIFSRMLVYHYDVHRWKYDNKFWLSDDGESWVQIIDGKEDVVGKLPDNIKRALKKYTPIITERERINSAYSKHQKCRKKSCICKKCDSYCYCDRCSNAMKECKKKTSIKNIGSEIQEVS